MRLLSRHTACILTGLTLTTAWATELYVAPTGKDSNPGTRAAPFNHFSTARDAARKFTGEEAVTIHVADGVYYPPRHLSGWPTQQKK